MVESQRFGKLICEFHFYYQVEFQTASGQMIDLITTLQGEKDLSKYTLSL